MTEDRRSSLAYFRWAFAVTAIGLVLGAVVGWAYTGTVAGTLSTFLICLVLAVLEISLSFDNAIVNANKLKTMTEVWRRRFLTWGILIAVFGMRIVFPLAVVVVAARVGPWEALRLAATEPATYARIMEGASLGISAFGGTFLMMVALSFFLDTAKEVHWLGAIETRLARWARLRGLGIGVALALMAGFAWFLPPGETWRFVTAALWGLGTFLAVDLLGRLLDRAGSAEGVAQGGLGAFLYLEVLDASFSFDGVIGAFALTQNLFIIAIGLGIGAMYVRSMTIMLVERGTLAEYRYLEHGAFYAILFLSIVMYAHTVVHVPEVVTGLGGVCVIALALRSSLRVRPGRTRAPAPGGAE